LTATGKRDIMNIIHERMMYMVTTNISFRVESQLKKDAEELFQDFGLTMNSAFVMFLKQSVREQRIPFSVSRNIPSDTTIAAVEEVRLMESDSTIGKSYSSASQMMEELLADDE
jgi:DNA-damage-inducible protein J